MKKTDRDMRLPLGRGVELLSRNDSGLMAFFKPAGVLSHPNTSKDIPRSLLMSPYDLKGEFYEVEAVGGERFKVWLLNRLDSATSGVLLCAVRPSVAEMVRQEFAEGRVRKKYHALVFGVFSPQRQVWRDRLRVAHEDGHLRATAKEGVEAETEARLGRFFSGRHPVSLIDMYPGTGRTHQLRVQCAKRKLPIVGDQTYGNFSLNREFAKVTGCKRLFLHSAEISVTILLAGKAVKFSARSPLPGEFTP